MSLSTSCIMRSPLQPSPPPPCEYPSMSRTFVRNSTLRPRSDSPVPIRLLHSSSFPSRNLDCFLSALRDKKSRCVFNTELKSNIIYMKIFKRCAQGVWMEQNKKRKRYWFSFIESEEHAQSPLDEDDRWRSRAREKFLVFSSFSLTRSQRQSSLSSSSSSSFFSLPRLFLSR